MQTFLPYPDFTASAKVLDRARLGKQRIEARQLLRAITNTGSGWSNHPAARMWRNHPEALIEYGNVIIKEWIARGYKNTMPILPTAPTITPPPWLGDPEFHSRHRAALLFKAPNHYQKLGWTETPQLNYMWPS